MAGFRALDQAPPDDLREHTKFLNRVRDVVNNIMQGKRNATLDVTLDANSATTVVEDPRIGGDSALLLMPMTATAKTAFAAGIYVTAIGDQTATLNHANTADADKDFRIVIDG